MKDLLGRPMDANRAGNLFTPGFGLPPHRLVGREDDLRELQDGLGAGPRDPRFTSVIIGHRGSGKTVLLSEIRGIAAEAGWVILRTDATTANLQDRIDAEIREFANPAVAGDLVEERSPGETTAALHAGPVGLSRRLSKTVHNTRSLTKKLEIIGNHAAERGSAVLLCVDELQAGRRDELRRLASDLQRLTKEDGLPIAFIGAGLPAMQDTILRDPKMTFFQRCHPQHLAPLPYPGVLSFFKQTIADAGGSCDTATLERMADATDGFAYRMQLIGRRAWTISGAPDRPVDMTSAEMAVTAAERHLRTQVYSDIWDSLDQIDRHVLRVAAEHGGTVPRSTLGAAVPASASSLATRLNRLRRLGVITRDADSPQADVRLGTLAPLDFVNEQLEEAASLESGASAELAVSVAARRTAAPRCGRRLKTKDAYCILRAGHSGNCRSR